MQYWPLLPLTLLCVAPVINAAPLQVSGSAWGYGYEVSCSNPITGPNQSVSCQGAGFGSTAWHSGTQISGDAFASAYGGTIYVPGAEEDGGFYSAWGFAQVDVVIQNQFVVTGGTGAATFEFGPDAYWAGSFGSCLMYFDGQMIPGCTPPEAVFNVTFGTPISIYLRLFLDLYGGPDGENWVTANYNLRDIVIKQGGRVVEGATFTPVPEPGPALSLGFGILSLVVLELRANRVRAHKL